MLTYNILVNLIFISKALEHFQLLLHVTAVYIDGSESSDVGYVTVFCIVLQGYLLDIDNIFTAVIYAFLAAIIHMASVLT